MSSNVNASMTSASEDALTKASYILIRAGVSELLESTRWFKMTSLNQHFWFLISEECHSNHEEKTINEVPFNLIYQWEMST